MIGAIGLWPTAIPALSATIQNPEMALDSAMAEFEARFSKIISAEDFVAKALKTGQPVWLSPSGVDFQVHMNFGVKNEGDSISVHQRCSTQLEAIEQWRDHIMRLPVSSGDTLCWRIEPEIDTDLSCYGGKSAIYSRFAIDKSPELDWSKSAWVDSHLVWSQ